MCSFLHEPGGEDVRRFRNGRITSRTHEERQSQVPLVPLIHGPAEDAIEAQSAAAGPDGREAGSKAFLDHWAAGVYSCARCGRELYHSQSKWKGPCAWPSFRCAASEDALLMRPVVGYGSYRCAVAELYCAKCHLFVGHRFQDAREKGDQAIECTGWRH